MKRVFAAFIVCLLALAPANSAVNSSTNRTLVLGNGSQTVFSFSFIGVSSAYITVLLTDSSGTQTTLTAGSGATQYQISLNAPVQGAIWGIGGTVTYNPSGTPIPSGSTLTIYRTLPLTQAINLQNLSSIAVLGKGAETGLDTGVMQGQQINETIGRAIVANIANSTAPAQLPAAAEMANQGLCGDSTGINVVACALPASGVISSAMQPVVNAASLAAGRTAFGLGTMAVEAINGGTCGGTTIQDDGSGNARVVFTQVADSTNQTVDCSYSQSQRTATGPITYTLPRANTLFAGWNFTVYVASGLVTFSTNANDNFRGVASGGSVTAASGSVCKLVTDAATSGSWQLNCNNSPPSLSASVGSSALTLTLNGTVLNFRDNTLANGDPFWALISSGISITVPSTATLGTSSSNVPFRLWIFAAYNSGTPVLGVATCSSATSTTAAVYPCTAWESIRKSGTAVSTGSTALGTLYTSSSVTNDSVRIIGYAEYASGLATAGSWASAPTTLQLCIAPFSCRMPGSIAQGPIYSSTTTNTTCTSSGFVTTAVSQAITPTSAVNLISYQASGSASNNTQFASAYSQMFRSGSAVGPLLIATMPAANAAIPVTMIGIDAPASTSSLTYAVKCEASAGTAGYPSTSGGNIILQEIMG